MVRDVSAATQTALKAVGLPSRSLGFFGHPPRHPLAETYFSQAPIRWGDHVGKLGLYPTQETVDALIETALELGGDPDVFRHAMVEQFAQTGAAFELRVQLSTDIDSMPIEDASVRWDEDDSPYRTIGVIRFPAQSAWNDAKAQAWDERMGFNPANSLEAHRPLGQIMRAPTVRLQTTAGLETRHERRPEGRTREPCRPSRLNRSSDRVGERTVEPTAFGQVSQPTKDLTGKLTMKLLLAASAAACLIAGSAAAQDYAYT